MARAVIEAHRPDVVVTTEDHPRPWAMFPHVVDAGNDWGYRTGPDRRKVIAWSKAPWRPSEIPMSGAAGGRLVVASTTAGLDLTVVGVCIPWPGAHVSSGRADRRRWDEHVEFCELLANVLARPRGSGPVVVAGDFNQRVRPTRQPAYAWEALRSALDGYEIATAADRACMVLIDHVAHDEGLTVIGVDSWPDTVEGRRLSDHAGVCVELTARRS